MIWFKRAEMRSNIKMFKQNIRAILVLSILVIIRESTGFCPSKCTCEGDGNLRASCVNAGLEVVPIQLNPNVVYMNLTLNQIATVHFAFAFYYDLETLDISNNKIESLGSKNFESQEKLRILNISTNNIVHLSKGSFRGLHNLIKLDLSSNQIGEIHETAFHDMKSLRELYLDGNKIISFEAQLFRNLNALDVLTLSKNEILEIPIDNLEYLRSLNVLDMSQNYIVTIQNESFIYLKELRILKLSGNIIMEFETGAFDGLNGLQFLDVSDNNLTIVPTLQLSKLSNLTNLSLSGNLFDSLPPVAFLNLFHLRELHLDRLDLLIKIDSRAFVDNTLLHTITMDDNPRFTDLPLRLFYNNPKLIEISIRGNNLRTLDAAQFPLDRLQRLQLSNNPLECNCSLLWLWRLTTDYVHKNDDDDADDDDVAAARGAASAASASASASAGDDYNYNQRKQLQHYNNNNNNKFLWKLNKTTNLLLLDKTEIGCDLYDDGKKIRKILRNLSESDIKCPPNMITVISAIISILLVIMTGISVMIYFIKLTKRRKKINQERKNVNERIVPQKVDKLELERYLQQQQQQQQQLANEYRALRPWDVPTFNHNNKYTNNEINEPDHYEHFEYLDTNKRTLTKPHIVYV